MRFSYFSIAGAFLIGTIFRAGNAVPLKIPCKVRILLLIRIALRTKNLCCEQIFTWNEKNHLTESQDENPTISRLLHIIICYYHYRHIMI